MKGVLEKAVPVKSNFSIQEGDIKNRDFFGSGHQNTRFLWVGHQKTRFLWVRTSKNEISLGHPPGLKNWIWRHAVGQIVSDVMPSCSDRIGVCTQLLLSIPVERCKMTGTPRGPRQPAVPVL